MSVRTRRDHGVYELHWRVDMAMDLVASGNAVRLMAEPRSKEQCARHPFGASPEYESHDFARSGDTSATQRRSCRIEE